MFDFTTVTGGFAAPDLKAVKAFYADVLGLEVAEEMDGYIVVVKLPGGRNVMAYEKADFQPSNATMLHFSVADIEAAVDQLSARGVAFERYDGFGQDDKGISRNDEGPPNAWFKDPAGNLLAIVED